MNTVLTVGMRVGFRSGAPVTNPQKKGVIKNITPNGGVRIKWDDLYATSSYNPGWASNYLVPLETPKPEMYLVWACPKDEKLEPMSLVPKRMQHHVPTAIQLSEDIAFKEAERLSLHNPDLKFYVVKVAGVVESVQTIIEKF